MKKHAFAIAMLMAMSTSLAQADDTPGVDASVAQFAGSILSNLKTFPEVGSNEQPNVDRSLGLFAGSILSNLKSFPAASVNDKPNVDVALGLFASSILN